MTSRFFKPRRGPAVIFGILFVLFAFVLSITLPTWLSVGTGNPASKTVTALTKNKDVRDEAARFFIEKLTEDASAEDLARFDELEATISDKLDELVANDEFMAKVGDVSDEVYDFFVNGIDQTQVVEAKAVVSDLVDALAEVDPEFANLKTEVNDWKGLELEPMNDGPDFKSIKDSLNSLFWVALILTIVDESDRFANAAVPIVADSLLSPFRTIGILWLVLGIGSIIGGVVVGRRTPATSGAADAND